MRAAVGLQCLALLHILLCCESHFSPFSKMEFVILNTWDSDPVNHDPFRIVFSDGKSGLKMEVSGPFFNTSRRPPVVETGQPYLGLSVFDVVQSSFLDSTKVNFLTVELGPYGQHLIRLYSGGNSIFMQLLPMMYTATITGDTWKGEALIPWTYFPPNVNKMNSYVGHDDRRGGTDEALYPIPKEDLVEGQKPNFNRLEYFQKFRLQSIMGEDWVQPESDLWRGKA